MQTKPKRRTKKIQPPSAPCRAFLTIDEVAQMLRLSYYRAYRMVVDGKVPALKLGKSWRVNPADLERYLSAAIVEGKRP